MKKVSLYLLYILLQYSAFCSAWKVHVLPVYRERMTGEWCGLFGRDAGAEWSTFKTSARASDDSLEVALKTLKQQTNGVYDLSYEKIAQKHSTITLHNNDVVYCFPIKHVSGPLLKKKMERSLLQDCTKDGFMWIPISEILNHNTIVKIAYGKLLNYKFDLSTRMMLSQNWNSQLKPRLNAAVNLYTNQKRLCKKEGSL